MTAHVLSEEDRTHRSIFPIDDLYLEDNVSVFFVEGVERNTPALGVIRILKNASMNSLNPEGLQSVRKGVVDVPHSV